MNKFVFGMFSTNTDNHALPALMHAAENQYGGERGNKDGGAANNYEMSYAARYCEECPPSLDTSLIFINN